MGEGVLYQEFLRRKALLEAEGVFNPERKRTIPASPRRIGIVTSSSGAALQDMLNTLRRRMPLARVVLAPATVQGEDAPIALINALHNLSQVELDVILVARGGGSIEDLWAFNDLDLVRAISESRIPVITGIGHETDFTLADFAADLRAPTPTAAAEMATPVTIQDLGQALIEMNINLHQSSKVFLQHKHDLLAGLFNRLGYQSPLRRVQNEMQRLDELCRRLNMAQLHGLDLARTELAGCGNRLTALNPLSILQRGYAIVTKDTKIVTSKSQVREADPIQVHVRDGEFSARVSGKE